MAQFLVIWAELNEQGQPQGGMEQLLIETLAQPYTKQHRWIVAANNYVNRACNRQEVEQENQ